MSEGDHKAAPARLRLGLDLSPIWRPSVASDTTVAVGIAEGLADIRPRLHDEGTEVVVAVDHHAPPALPAALEEFEVVRFRGGPRLATNPTTLLWAYRHARVDAGLYHHFGPWFRRHGTVTLVHDIVHEDDPDAFGPVEGRYLNLRKPSVRRSTRVLCPSNTTAAELIRHGYRSDRSRIDVVVWGAQGRVDGDRARPPGGLARVDRPFALAVGRVTERKRLPLAAAIVAACSSTDRLVVVGPVEDEQIADELRRLPHVEVLGRVDDAELDWLYRNAQATLLTSRSEGFGLPLIEAAQRGCPVLCSALPVFREVGDGLDGVDFFDAEAPGAIREAADRLAALVENGRSDPTSVSERFSWTATASTVIDSLRRAATDSR